MKVKEKAVCVRKILPEAIHQLEAAGIENPRLEVELLLAHLLQISRLELYTHWDEVDFPRQKFQTLLTRRAQREPLAYIIGQQEFWSLELRVAPQVLIPRPETEFVIEAAIKYLPERARIIDVGTGSGNIAICLAREIRKAHIYALDLSEAALQLARHNAERHGVTGQITFLQSNLLSCFAPNLHSRPTISIDALVSNPPYIPSAQISGLAPEVADFEPRLALDGGADGLDCYRRLFFEARKILKTWGWLIIEIGYGQKKMLVREFECQGYEVREVISDYAGLDRVIVARLRA